MAPAKKELSPKREPPIQLRPGPELGRLIGDFAAQAGLPVNEACKRLIALALTSMDVRYHDLVGHLADAMGGAFVHACIHVQSALSGAALAGQPKRLEPERSLFILKVVQDLFLSKGRQLPDLQLWFLPEAEQATEQGPAWSSTQPKQDERVRARP